MVSDEELSAAGVLLVPQQNAVSSEPCANDAYWCSTAAGLHVHALQTTMW